MNQKLIKIILFIFLSISISSCTKEEGFGGKATIRGIVREQIYDRDFTVFQSETAAIDEDVFIEFGDNHTVGDNVKTSASGHFEFNYLLPGTYRIYIYSEDTAKNTTTKIPIIQEITISKDDGTIDIGAIFKYKSIDFDDGSSMAKGIIGAKFYSNNFGFIYNIGYAKDHDVYLIHNNHPYSDVRVRTLFDGTYAFPNLIKGTYKLYTFSDNSNGIPSEVTKEFEITENNQVVEIDSISVNIETNYKL